jgi:hypothetical protein
MAMKLVKESEMRVTKGGKDEKKVKGKKDYKISKVAAPVACVTKKSITIISADKVIHCERRESGTTSNCAICEGLTKEIFDRCKNKWTDY